MSALLGGQWNSMAIQSVSPAIDMELVIEKDFRVSGSFNLNAGSMRSLYMFPPSIGNETGRECFIFVDAVCEDEAQRLARAYGCAKQIQEDLRANKSCSSCGDGRLSFGELADCPEDGTCLLVSNCSSFHFDAASCTCLTEMFAPQSSESSPSSRTDERGLALLAAVLTGLTLFAVVCFFGVRRALAALQKREERRFHELLLDEPSYRLAESDASSSRSNSRGSSARFEIG